MYSIEHYGKDGIKRMIRIGFLGPGAIASVMADVLKKVPLVELYAVASRDLERAEAFKKIHKFSVAYGSYDDLYGDPSVDLIYIATPHAFHYEQMMAAIAHHKNIICEKAFCLNRKEAEAVFLAAEEAGVFVAEAMIPAYLPSRVIIDEVIKENLIGDLLSFHGVFGAPLWHVKRVREKDLGGGALLDIGVYPLYFVLTHFGPTPRIEQVYLNEVNGVDQSETIIMRYDNRFKVSITISAVESLGIYGEIIGTNGSIYIENIARPEWIEVRNQQHEVIKRLDASQMINGYECEFIRCVEDIKAGKLTSSAMKKEDTIMLLDYLDRIRWFHIA